MQQREEAAHTEEGAEEGVARRAVPRTREATRSPCSDRCAAAARRFENLQSWALERVTARELGGCKGSRARHVEMRER